MIRRLRHASDTSAFKGDPFAKNDFAVRLLAILGRSDNEQADVSTVSIAALTKMTEGAHLVGERVGRSFAKVFRVDLIDQKPSTRKSLERLKPFFLSV